MYLLSFNLRKKSNYFSRIAHLFFDFSIVSPLTIQLKNFPLIQYDFNGNDMGILQGELNNVKSVNKMI